VAVGNKDPECHFIYRETLVICPAPAHLWSWGFISFILSLWWEMKYYDVKINGVSLTRLKGVADQYNRSTVAVVGALACI
jgi:hypothetical protein